jgi:hypothetical protein
VKVTKSQLKELIRQSIVQLSEEGDDKFTHIGYGKYKKKGKEKDKSSPTFKKDDGGKYVPVKGSDSKGKEKPKDKPKTTKIDTNPFAKDDEKNSDDYAPDGGHFNAATAANTPTPKQINILNKLADKGDNQLIDTERYGMVSWENGEPGEDTFFATDEDGESIELDYDEIIRFHNPDVLDGSNDIKSLQKDLQYYIKQYDNAETDDDKEGWRAAIETGKKELQNLMQKRGRNESVNESIRGKKITVKEIKQWMRTLEENRYRKIVQADARRVAWFVNNHMNEDMSSMPKSLVKKWKNATYSRERYLAKEYLRQQNNRKMNEVKGISLSSIINTTNKRG